MNLYPIVIEIIDNLKVFGSCLKSFLIFKHSTPQLVAFYITLTLASITIAQKKIFAIFRKLDNSINKNFLHNLIVIALDFLTFITIVWMLFYFLLNMDSFLLWAGIVLIEVVVWRSYFITRKAKKENTSVNPKSQESSPPPLLISDTDRIELSPNSSGYTYVDELKNIINSLDSDSEFYSIALNGGWGAGKTSILNTLMKELEQDGYKVIWLNVWQLKNTDNLIGEIERALLSFFKEVIYFIPQEFYNYFELLNSLHGNKSIEKAASYLLSRVKKATFEDSTRVTNELIEKALSYSKKKKLIFIFDDIDRVLDKKESVELLKTIRYVTNFNNAIAVSGLDMKVVANIIKKEVDSLDSSFINKIFNLVIGIYHTNDQYELVNYLRTQWNIISDIKKEDYLPGIDKDALKEINAFIKGGEIYDLFQSYREIKLTLNDFTGTYMIMNRLAKKINDKVSSNINMKDLFLMSSLKVIDVEFYNDFLVTIKKDIEKREVSYDRIKELHIPILKYLNRELLYTEQREEDKENDSAKNNNKELIFKNYKCRRIYSIFKQLGVEFEHYMTGLYFELPGYLSIGYEDIFEYYFNPAVRQYKFSDPEIEKHIEELINDLSRERVNKIVIDKIEKLPKVYSYEYKEIFKGYLRRCYSFIDLRSEEIEPGNRLKEIICTEIIELIKSNQKSYFKDIEPKFIKEIFEALFRSKAGDIYSEEHIIDAVLSLIECNDGYLVPVINTLFDTTYSKMQSDSIGLILEKWIVKMNKQRVFDYKRLAILLYFHKIGTDHDVEQQFAKYTKTILADIKNLEITTPVDDDQLGKKTYELLLKFYENNFDNLIVEIFNANISVEKLTGGFDKFLEIAQLNNITNLTGQYQKRAVIKLTRLISRELKTTSQITIERKNSIRKLITYLHGLFMELERLNVNFILNFSELLKTIKLPDRYNSKDYLGIIAYLDDSLSDIPLTKTPPN